GFDTYGIKQFLTSSDPADIFDGFYIDDHGAEGTAGDLPEVELHATIGAGASVGVAGLVEAGVEAGITGTVDFDLNDVVVGAAGHEVGDGKVRIEDFIDLTRAGPLCFLDVEGSIDWFLNAFVWVGLDLGFFGRITLWDENFSLGSGNIVEFEHHCPVIARPTLAHMSGGELVLHMGTDAGLRVTETDGSAAESYTVDYLAAGSSLKDYNIDGSPATAATNVLVVQYNGYAEVYNAASVGRIVVNDAAGGADSLTVGAGVAADVAFHGGEGDDRVTSQSSGDHVLYGDAGKDRLAVVKAAGHSAGTARLYGGDGDDTLTTSDGNDSVYGGDGNDKIKTGLGDDYVEGGDESVAVAGAKANGDTIDTGSGNDTIYGGTGSDAIKAGDGNDLIYGGDESGLLPSGKALGDSIDAGKGNDTVHAGAGSDAIKGGDGDDQLWGGSGDDSFTAGKGIDQVRGEAGGDTIYWTVGDGVDSVIDGGTDGDGIIVTGADVDTDIELSNSSGNVLVAWGANDLLTQNTEKFTLNAGQGADHFTIRDLAGTPAREISISLGGAIVESTIYDYDKNGAYGDDPPAMLDGEGAVIYDRFGSALLKDVYDDGTPVPYKVVRAFVDDGQADSVVIYGGAGDDVFSGATARDADGLYVLNVSRQTPSILYSVDQGAAATDGFTLYTLGGNDNVDFKDVGKDRDSGESQLLAMTLDVGAGNDLILGTQWNDSLVSGSGDDRVSGNRGVDSFSDASGNDQLIETRDSNFTISRNVLTIGSEAESTIAPFETVILNGGAAHNTFNVSDWTGTLRMDGAGEGDVYNIHYRGAGDSVITENDSGGTLGTSDAIHVFGTAGQDFFFLDANNGDPADTILTDGHVQVAHGSLGADGSFHPSGTSETFNYTHSESLDIHAGAGDDYFTVDDVAIGMDVYGDEGSDNFMVGRVLEEALVGGIPVATKISNGISVVSRFYGDDGTDDTPAAGYAYGDDYFEVNHNVAEIWLYGDAGDDTFVINAHLTDNDPSDDPLRNVRGGTGNNTISYVQNAAVNIDGGAGNDTVIVNGTAIGDTFIVTTIEVEVSPGVFELRQQVVGAGLQIKMTDVEKLEVNGAGGDDHIYVFGTLDGLDVTVRGGTGNDTIVIGGDAVTVTVDPPPYIYQPPTQTIDPAPYIDHYDNYSFSWGDYWYWTWSFPFLKYQPLITYTWSVPVWVDPAPYTVTPAAYTIDPDPINFTAGPKYTLNEAGHAGGTGADAFKPGIRGKLTVDGQLDSDTLVIHDEDGNPADTATFDTYSDDKGLHYHVGGLGMGPDGLTYTRVEQFDLHMGPGDDLVTVDAIDPVTHVTLNLGNGADRVDVRAMEGDLEIDGGSGDDTVNVGSLAPAVTGGDLAGIAGELAFIGGTGTDVFNVDDTEDASDRSAVLTGSTLTGLGMAAGVGHYEVDTLNLRLGGGADVLEIEGTTAVTNVWGNGGDDVFHVSSDGAALSGSLDDVMGVLT
ncbi:MAG TPA: calcium-binding protein, partial [Rhodocyclaceae bacterium]|nr:calcium-binding protein [Rhodocyclaceae bacterium]